MAKQKETANETTAFGNFQDQQEIVAPTYTIDEEQWRLFWLQRAEDARNDRDSQRDDFNGIGYIQRYNNNFRAGNSYAAPRRNADETSITTGTTREKKLTVVNNVINLNFDTYFRAFDKNDMELAELGEAMSDMVFRCKQIEQWDANYKLNAYSELVDQGDVFVEFNWVEEYKNERKNRDFTSLTEEDYKKAPAEPKKKLIYSGVRRTIIPGTQVYLGDVRQILSPAQPFVLTREVIPYSLAKSRYGGMFRFQNVPRNLQDTGNLIDGRWGYNWRLESVTKDMVEVLKGTDNEDDSYFLSLNGVSMLPVHYAKPWRFDGYNLVQGGLEPISAFLAYHKSIPDKSALDQQILDEMLRLSVLKNQKSYMPPIANYSANILTSQMFQAGKINNGLEKGEIEVLGGNPNMYSVTQSEFEMYKLYKQQIDDKTVSPALQGQSFGSRTTATEVDSVTERAKQNLGIMIFGFMNFNMKMDQMALNFALENYTKPIGKYVDETTEQVKNKFVTLTMDRSIPGRGNGTKIVDVTDEFSSPASLYDEEEGIKRDEMGRPISVNPPKKPMKRLQVNPYQVLQYTFYPEVVVNERESSLAERISFEDRIMKSYQLFGPESVNQEHAKQIWATKNKLNYNEFFNANQPMPGQMPGGAPQVPGMEESVMNKQTRMSPTGVQEAVRQGYGQ